MSDEQNDPRLDPVGTVRQDSKGRQVVKVSMGDDTGKGQHVWVHMDTHLDCRWFHHVEVEGLSVLTPSTPGRKTEWGMRMDNADAVRPELDETEARRRVSLQPNRRTLVNREVGPWIEVQL